MASVLPDFVQFCGTAFATEQGDVLAGAIPLDEGHQFTMPLRAAVGMTSREAISPERLVQYLQNVPSDAREGVGRLISAVLIYVAGPDKGGGGEEQEEAEEADEAYGIFTRLQAVYVEANRLYIPTSDPSSSSGNTGTAFLNPLIVALARSLAQISVFASALSTSPSREPSSARSISDSTRQTIERSFQLSTTSYSSSEWEMQVGREWVMGDVAWTLGNILWRIYAQRNLHTQANELRRNFVNLSPAEDKRLASRGGYVPATEVCQAWYWRGRLSTIWLDFRMAEVQLGRALNLCADAYWSQKRSILLRLIPVKLVLGFLPSPGTLQEYELEEYSTLVHAFRTGNVAAWRRELEGRRDWYRARGVWVLLYERGEILVWRNLFRRALLEHYRANPTAQPGRCPTSALLSATRAAFKGTGEIEDGDVELEDVVCILSSLIDQGLVLGYLAFSQQTLVMRSGEDGMGGFPRIRDVNPRKVLANT